MKARRAEPVARSLHTFSDELLVAVAERFEVGQDMDVDEVRREFAHGYMDGPPVCRAAPRW